jgi:S-adenosylmethionine:tRNA ribosyltransferase-isomerase
VLNDTRVVPARLRGRKASGGACEILLERLLGPRRLLAQARASKGLRPGGTIDLPGGARAAVIGRREDFYELELDCEALPYLEAHGSMPLPPYLGREAEAADRERYQTVYAGEPGAVAAPTAGLHFDEAMLARLPRAGVGIAKLTLHVGAGTFQPLRAETVEAHRLHAERYRLPAETVAAIAATRARGGRVVAVGTTVVRALETVAAPDGTVSAGAGQTSLVVTPERGLRAIDGLITGWHEPESSHLSLLEAAAGPELLRRSYAAAHAAGYRFHEFGDSHLILP